MVNMVSSLETAVHTAPLPAEADAHKPEGVDVSNHNGYINWHQVAEAGIDFAFAKATEGTGFIDAFFQRNWVGMKDAGILRGAYHYFRPGLDPVHQADNFLRQVRSLADGDLQPMLDVEEADGMQAGMIAAGAKVWINAVEAALGRNVIIYTYPWFWQSQMRNTQLFSHSQPLWIARYGIKPEEPLVGGWPFYSFWQYTDKGWVAGVTGQVDRDRFNGSLENLRKFAQVPHHTEDVA
jgi:lysozyme